MFTLFIDLGLALVAALMLLRGHYTITRQVAAVPLAVALIDASFAPQIQLALTPVVSGVLVALQAIILLFSIGVLREDASRARQQRARQRRREEIARAQAAARHTAPTHRSIHQAA